MILAKESSTPNHRNIIFLTDRFPLYPTKNGITRKCNETNRRTRKESQKIIRWVSTNKQRHLPLHMLHEISKSTWSITTSHFYPHRWYWAISTFYSPTSWTSNPKNYWIQQYANYGKKLDRQPPTWPPYKNSWETTMQWKNSILNFTNPLGYAT